MKNNFNNFELRNKKNFARSIEENINQVLQPLFSGSKKEFILINNLVKNWSQIIGKKYARFCSPKMVSFSKDHKSAKLTIIAYNSAIAFFIENNCELIIETIASLYGYKTINKIIVKQQPQNIINPDDSKIILNKIQEEYLQKKIINFENEDLAQTIADLGRVIIKNNNPVK
jgi:hypothetical protein